MDNKIILPNQNKVSRQERSLIKGHQPLVLWLTGLSGSGKSTIANVLESELNHHYRVHTYLLDGDNIRSGLNAGLGFSNEDRAENVRRTGEVAKLMYDAGLIVITAFISPFRNSRNRVRQLFQAGAFWEVFVSCPLEVCQARDPKGLYKKAIKGELLQFTGISSAYEVPVSPEIVINTQEHSVEECVGQIIRKLLDNKIIGNP